MNMSGCSSFSFSFFNSYSTEVLTLASALTKVLFGKETTAHIMNLSLIKSLKSFLEPALSTVSSITVMSFPRDSNKL